MNLAIIGKQCAGKTALANGIIRALNGAGLKTLIVKFAGPIYVAQESLIQPKTRAFMQEYSDLAKKHFGQDVFVRAFRRHAGDIAAQQPGTWLICDDLRYEIEFNALKETGFKIVCVDAPAEIRRKRAEAQGLDFIENHSSEQEIDGLKQYADLVFVNEDGEIGLIDQMAVLVLRELGFDNIQQAD